MGREESGSESNGTTRRKLSLGLLGMAGILAGCQSVEQGSAEQVESPTAVGDNEMLTFGEDNDWGIQYNSVSNEFEIVHKPDRLNPRRNIRIEADTNEDRGDVYIDDSLIVKNEVEVSDGSAEDPSYTFTNRNNVGFWRVGAGALGVSTRGVEAARFDEGNFRVAGDITTSRDGTFGSRKTVWDAEAGHTPRLPSTEAVASGDGSRRTFSLTHPLQSPPGHVSITPTSEDAAGAFWVSQKTASAVEVTYTEAPPAGQENLRFDVIASL